MDAAGEILWGDQIMLLLARDILAERPGAPIIAEHLIETSNVAFDDFAGGQADVEKNR